jgi:hypothetical protein
MLGADHARASVVDAIISRKGVLDLALAHRPGSPDNIETQTSLLGGRQRESARG